ncbi:MAG: DUF6361 family protein [Nesterenkonia sp.]|uniref:DUF6361 family protein n=1 Tax=Nesterenkonia marinintestina TaxID=2979865 RepID=UPI0021BF8D33|nr:DUF6361 family protein [Nesterenkonia sp. GX14115]MDO5492627.1 DUF6361 family protein [Nesterenkonia sp.]
MGVKIAWADSSPEQQRRMREIAALFSERESREELGLASLRDDLADILFPGTSTLHTRAKYLLFVPWCYQIAMQRASPDALHDTARRLERELIRHFPQDSDRMGLIGAQAGAQVKSLPSSLYWRMLTVHRIVIPPQSPTARRILAEADADSLPPLLMARGLPAAPEGFPRNVPGGFSLDADQARWLQDTLQMAEPHSVLAHLLRRRPDLTSRAPWEDPSVVSMPQIARDHMRIAEAFSLFIHGAQLLYNLLLAETHRRLTEEKNGPEPETGTDDLILDYRERIHRWADEAEQAPAWDVEELFHLVESRRRRGLPPGVRRFVHRWSRHLAIDGPHGVATSSDARRLVAAREQLLKGPQSRLENRRLLSQWSGASGSARMVMRWNTVRTIIGDIWDGVDDGA